MRKYGDKVAEKFFRSPKYIQFIFSWVIIIVFLVFFFWLNDRYFHLGGDTTECSGTFEYNCGDIEDVDDRINDYNDYGNE